MPRTGLYVLLSVLFSAVGLAQSADESAIRARLAACSAARVQGSGDAQAAFYTDDADAWLSTNRKMVRGRQEIAADLNLPPNPARRFVITPRTIAILKPDVALVDSEWGVSEDNPSGMAFYVLLKKDGLWLIRSARVTRYVEPGK